jgi:hypothetical protein
MDISPFCLSEKLIYQIFFENSFSFTSDEARKKKLAPLVRHSHTKHALNNHVPDFYLGLHHLRTFCPSEQR